MFRAKTVPTTHALTVQYMWTVPKSLHVLDLCQALGTYCWFSMSQSLKEFSV